MDFESYTKLILQSAATCGYDRFLPSLCVSTDDTEELSVLETDLLDEGEKAIALDWALQFTGANQRVYCAYRIGSRQIEVIEVTGAEVTDKRRVNVRPFSADQ